MGSLPQAKAIGQAETEERDGDLELDGAQLVEVRAYISPRLSVAHAHLPAPHRHTRNVNSRIEIEIECCRVLTYFTCQRLHVSQVLMPREPPGEEDRWL